MSTHHIEDIATMEADADANADADRSPLHTPTPGSIPPPQSPRNQQQAPLSPLHPGLSPPPAFTSTNANMAAHNSLALTRQAFGNLPGLVHSDAAQIPIPASPILPGIGDRLWEADYDSVFFSNVVPVRLRLRRHATRSHNSSPPLQPDRPPYCITPVFQPSHGQQILLISRPSSHSDPISTTTATGWVTHAANNYDRLLTALASSNVTMTLPEALTRYAHFLAFILTYPPFIELFGTHRRLTRTPVCERSFAQRAWLTLYPRYRQDEVEEFHEVVRRLYGFDPQDIGLDASWVDLRVVTVHWPFRVVLNGGGPAMRRGGGAMRRGEELVSVGAPGEAVGGIEIGI
ncbi:hypothetical protein LTR36_004161 [Oleoguttula mirabilis]|uniref:Uncharacterized protein n=1 Tax=Oleoguttula mirabilis TaxID=1507867 RepID=A0AAV9JHM8_9PEZI|nr:hypothetical protein LTR36_004161 [Oleoguttula mirabilis]